MRNLATHSSSLSSLLLVGGLAFGSLNLGCSREPGNTSATTDGPLPAGFDENGYFVKCEPAEEPEPTTGAGPSDMIICVEMKSFEQYDLVCNDGLQSLYGDYIQAICANTFGGAPSDYKRVNPLAEYPYNTEVSGFPNPGDPARQTCDVTKDYGDFDEFPEVTNRELFPGLTYDRCEFDSMCAAYDAIIGEYPSDGIVDDPFCNTSPSGNPALPRPWLCIGSSDEACGVMITPSAEDPSGPVCPPGAEYEERETCVIAVTEAAAKDECEALCSAKHDYLSLTLGPTEYPEELHCGVFADNFLQWASDPGSQCGNLRELEPISLVPFSFSLSLVTDDGGSTASAAATNLGEIDYEISNCGSTTCDIRIRSVTLSHQGYGGTFYDAAGGPHAYTVDGVSLRLLQPVTGSLNVGSGVISFPSDVFRVWLTTGAVTFDGMTFGAPEAAEVTLSQVVGSWYQPREVLTLNISYNTVDANVAVTLTTF